MAVNFPFYCYVCNGVILECGMMNIVINIVASCFNLVKNILWAVFPGGYKNVCIIIVCIISVYTFANIGLIYRN